MEACILSVDIGTSMVKAGLFTPQMAMLACARAEYRLDTGGGLVELDAGTYFNAFREGVARLPAELLARVGAIGVASQGETLVAVGGDGQPLAPAIVWLDSRAEAQAGQLRQSLDSRAFYSRTGLPGIGGSLPLAKLLWLRQRRPEIYKKTACFLLAEDYMLYRLCGRLCTEKSVQCSTGYFDITRADGWWGEALEAAGVGAGKLPELLEPGQVAGRLLPGAARALGLKAGIPVCTGAMDQTAAALAAGCNRVGRVAESTGTALVAAAYTRAPAFSAARPVTVYRHALPGAFLYIPIGNTGGMALKWFRDGFFEGAPAFGALDEQ
ncbi:MAG: hypothetical protein LBJ10_07305, partial [Clostridiales bacterium]|nr:hypothetical protein [Clostridiales bacterium]